MTYAQFIKWARRYARNRQPLTPITDAWGAGKLTGLPTAKARTYLERMTREGKATREKPHRKVFYTIGGAA